MELGADPTIVDVDKKTPLENAEKMIEKAKYSNEISKKNLENTRKVIAEAVNL